MTVDLRAALLARAESMTPQQQLAYVRGLREKAREIRRQQAATLVDVDSPGALAVAIGQQQRPHLALLDRLHVRAASGEVVRAIVALPPRVGKTERLLKVGSAWRLNRDPDCRVMQISGGKSLVEQSSRWVRDELERPEAGYRYRPRRDVRAVSDWRLQDHEGGIFIGSIGSRIIGRGANLLQVDDLIGRPEEAESKVYRDKAWRFLQAAFGRLEPNASTLIVNSRWHPDDPVGRLLKEQPGMWEYLAIPALAERHGFDEETGKCLCGDPWLGEHADPLGRAPGEALWPERYDVDALENSRLMLGATLFAAQFQQRPRRREGGLWKEEWITGRRGPGRDLAGLRLLTQRTVSVDPSASDDDGGDEAGIIVGGRETQTSDVVVTHDLSGTMTPEGWARTALVAAFEADAVLVYEQNLTPAFMRRAFRTAWQGLQVEAAEAERDGHPPGTVEPVIGTDRVPLPRLMPQTTPVRAKVGKELRAGPVAQRYEQQRVVHAGAFPLLEDQLLTWKPTDKGSPDRLDALVHLVTYLGDSVQTTTTLEVASGTVPIGAGTAAPSGYR